METFQEMENPGPHYWLFLERRQFETPWGHLVHEKVYEYSEPVDENALAYLEGHANNSCRKNDSRYRNTSDYVRVLYYCTYDFYM